MQSDNPADSQNGRHRMTRYPCGLHRYVEPRPTHPAQPSSCGRRNVLTVTQFGAIFGQVVFDEFRKNNELVRAGEAESTSVSNAKVLNLGMLGLMDACLDVRYIAEYYPHFATNNTYGIEAYGTDVFADEMTRLHRPDGGCLVLVDRCRALARAHDPLGYGNIPDVNQACGAASMCLGEVGSAFGTSGVSLFLFSSL